MISFFNYDEYDFNLFNDVGSVFCFQIRIRSRVQENTHSESGSQDWLDVGFGQFVMYDKHRVALYIFIYIVFIYDDK